MEGEASLVLRPCLPPLRQNLSLRPEDLQLGSTGGPGNLPGFSFLSFTPGITVECYQAWVSDVGVRDPDPTLLWCGKGFAGC